MRHSSFARTRGGKLLASLVRSSSQSGCVYDPTRRVGRRGSIGIPRLWRARRATPYLIHFRYPVVSSICENLAHSRSYMPTKEKHADSEYLSTLERGLSVLRAFGRDNP